MAEDKPYVCNLDEETLKKAKEELNEDPSQRLSQIDTLRQWVKAQPHINSRLDSEFLVRFLRTAKFSQIRAQEILDNFWTIRSVDARDWFQDMDPLTERNQEIMDLGVQVPLPGYDNHGRKVLLIRTGHYDPKQYPLGEVLKVGNMLTDILLMEERNQVHGFVGILDFTEFATTHVFNWDRATIQKASKCWQDAYPQRNKAMNYYNTPTIFNALFEIFKYFMKEKMKNRLFFHKDSLESLYQQVPKRMLPEEYGGDAGPIDDIVAEWKQKMIDHRDEYLLNAKYGVDQSKRPLPPQKEESLGVVGSFRKLAV